MRNKIKIYFVSLGCDKNLVDSEVMMGLINRKGYILVNEPDDAEVIIINTCGFIMDATNESIKTVLNLGEYKSGNCKALILAGCMVQRYKEQIHEELPEVDAVVGVNDYEGICGVIEKALGNKNLAERGEEHRERAEIGGQIDTGVATDKPDDLYKRFISTPGYFSYLKISEGCDNFCTYCTIPQIRGKYTSRTLESLIQEAGYLAENGIKELILVAQDTAQYGKDLYGESRLHELLGKLSEIDGIEWIRLLYCYPEHITDATLEEMSRNPKVCNYLDIPVQHSEDKILKLMGRRTTKAKLKAIIENIRKKIPDISLRTTIMTGFPGETDEDFNGLCSFLEETAFDRLGVITYSREENTPAYGMAGQVSEKTKKTRKKEVMELQQRLFKNERAVGKTLKVIVDGRTKVYKNGDMLYSGRSYMDSYEIDGRIYFKSRFDILSGEFVDVKITEADIYDLTGELV